MDSIDNNNLSDQIVEALPFGLYILNEEMQIIYYNQAFADIFGTDLHKVLPYFGALVNCSYCINGEADKSNPICSNCLIIRQHKTCLNSQKSSGEQEVVQEFMVQGKKMLKFLKIQSIPLNQNRVMALVQDYTQEAEKLVNPPS